MDARTPVSAVRNASTAREALASIARRQAFRVVEVSPTVFKLVEAGKPTPVQVTVPPVDRSPIVVTGRKRRELLSDVPGTVSVIVPAPADGTVPGSDSIANALPSISQTQAGPGANQLFIRGIGDAPLGGLGQQSVAFLLDNARLTYDGPDPDLALVDLQRVEVLEGPQGPLYGTGALGGIVRLIPNAPDLSDTAIIASSEATLTDHAGLGYGGNAVLNLPMNGRTAVRAVAYGKRRPGWIDDDGGRQGINDDLLVGGRLAFRWLPAHDWTVDANALIQSRHSNDSRYVDGSREFARPTRRREPIDSDIRIATLNIRRESGAVDFQYSGSISTNEVDRRFATAINTLDVPTLLDSRSFRTIDQEVRLSSDGRIKWLAGLSVLLSRTHAFVGMDKTESILLFDRSVSEIAAFGEAGTAIANNLDIAIGGRAFSSRVKDHASQGSEDLDLTPSTIRLTPSATIRWRPSSGLTAYARFATAYRPGGVGIGQLIIGGDDEYRGDTLRGFEVGFHFRKGSLSVDGAGFSSFWKSVQADFLLPNGLIATRNVGDAQNFGVQGSLKFTIAGFEAEMRGIAQRAQLEGAGNYPIELDDRRLPIVPDFAGRIEVARKFKVGEWKGRITLAANGQGATRLSFDPSLDQRMPGRVSLQSSISIVRGPWSASLVGQNLTNADSDAYAFGNPFLVRTYRERTPSPPRSIGLSLSRAF